ncbi:unnamed protein product [Owenia fusiformis]|uniref:EGF-like domain-containing protein n=1 Tax=Owenia fusiformis TaxID=6347 RepID=A0A8S4NIR2_OWEFU|nr:unnamed protein product [Owenia fusiformis]
MSLLWLTLVATLLNGIDASGYGNGNECEANPCSNDGICILWEEAPYCFCPPNYTGDLCDDYITAQNDTCDCLWPSNTGSGCSPNPCFNEGQCVQAYGNYKCICPGKSEGDRCHKASKEVECWSWKYKPKNCSAPSNHSNGYVVDLRVAKRISRTICVPNVNYGLYNNDTIWVIDGCRAIFEIDCVIDACIGVTCTPPLMCQNNYDSYACIQNENPCTDTPCLNGATCDNYESMKYNCTCPTGYYGDNCEFFDYCGELAPCENGATCANDENDESGYNCTCPEWFEGQNCSDAIPNGCDSSPCQNNATCIPYPGLVYNCTCLEGFTGDDCESVAGFSLNIVGVAPTKKALLKVYDSATGWSSSSNFDIDSTSFQKVVFVPEIGTFTLLLYVDDDSDGLFLTSGIDQGVKKTFTISTIVAAQAPIFILNANLVTLYECFVTLDSVTVPTALAPGSNAGLYCFFYPELCGVPCVDNYVLVTQQMATCSGSSTITCSSDAVSDNAVVWPGGRCDMGLVIPNEEYRIICDLSLDTALATGDPIDVLNNSNTTTSVLFMMTAFGGNCPIINDNGGSPANDINDGIPFSQTCN